MGDSGGSCGDYMGCTVEHFIQDWGGGRGRGDALTI